MPINTAPALCNGQGLNALHVEGLIVCEH